MEMNNDNEHTICIETPKTYEIDYITLQKMTFLYNAIESGWEVKRKENTYVFTKKHQGKKEIYNDSYLKTFIQANMNVKNII
jgi:hypothetical protein